MRGVRQPADPQTAKPPRTRSAKLEFEFEYKSEYQPAVNLLRANEKCCCWTTARFPVSARGLLPPNLQSLQSRPNC